MWSREKCPQNGTNNDSFNSITINSLRGCCRSFHSFSDSVLVKIDHHNHESYTLIWSYQSLNLIQHLYVIHNLVYNLTWRIWSASGEQWKLFYKTQSHIIAVIVVLTKVHLLASGALQLFWIWKAKVSKYLLAVFN